MPDKPLVDVDDTQRTRHAMEAEAAVHASRASKGRMEASEELEAVTSCDLCGSTALREVATASPARCRTVLCTGCGLMFASPRLSRSRLDQHYDDEFLGDAGSNSRLKRDAPDQSRLAKKRVRFLEDWALPLVKRHVTLEGARVLDVRCRTGALSSLLAAEGAKVLAMDSFEANLDIARRQSGVADLLLVPITEFETVDLPAGGDLDAVVALNVHVLAHLRSPRQWLGHVYQLLKPGGRLILDEKNVLLPVKQRGSSVFDSGPAHNYHFTLSTLRRYALSAGFEIIECAIDETRATAFQHMVLVAQKPLEPGRRGTAPFEGSAGEAAAVAARLNRLERSWALYRARNLVQRSRTKLLRATKPFRKRLPWL
jgi:2-polyprenyl-3-methyl-5-hydroxy-6-metoxy-1,4-benzoquinol methylase